MLSVKHYFIKIPKMIIWTLKGAMLDMRVLIMTVLSAKMSMSVKLQTKVDVISYARIMKEDTRFDQI